MINLEAIRDKFRPFLMELGEFLKAASNFDIEIKSSKIDFVTSIDKECEEKIIKFIQTNFASFSILSEESGEIKGSSPWTFVIDPIDGTTNFIHRYPIYSISIGLKKDDETMLGMVYLPLLGFFFHAIRGSGAFLNEQRLSVSLTSSLDKALISTGFPYSRATYNPNLKYFNKIINKIAGIRRSGSAAADLCFLAAGFCDGYFEFCINEWDYIAGELILSEAGGHVEHIKLEKDIMFFYTNSKIDSWLKEALFS